MHCDPPVASCSYLVQTNLSSSSKSPCSQTICQENRDHAKLNFATILSVLSKNLREPSDEVLLSDILDSLANMALCLEHMLSAKKARNQWYMELNDGEFLFKMEATYRNFSDGNFSDEEEDSDDVEVNEKGVPVPLIQSSSFQWVLRTPDILDSEVAENVTQLLESKVEGLNSNCGWIYIFSTDAEGMFKIGYSSRPPSLHRYARHTACYKHVVEVMTDLIPYARLVEQLVLTELASRHCRLSEKCKCRSVHKEWLMIDQETLLRTVEKWVKFIKTYPYSPQGILRKDLPLPSPALTSKRPRGSRNSTPQKARASTPKKREGSTPTKREDSTPTKREDSTSKQRKDSSTKKREYLTPTKRQDSTPTKREDLTPIKREDLTPTKRDSTTKQRKDSAPKCEGRSKSTMRDLTHEFEQVLTFSEKWKAFLDVDT